MKFPKKLIAFGLSLCMSVVPCGPVAAEDFYRRTDGYDRHH